MVVDVFPVYNVLVNQVFGSVGLALLGVAAALLIILILTRNTWTMITNWMMFYGITVFAFYVGSLGLFLAFMVFGGITIYNVVVLFFRQFY